MWGLKNIRWLPVLMAGTILAITGFQLYWLDKTYEREERTLEMRTNMLFRETVLDLQVSKLKLERMAADSIIPAGTPAALEEKGRGDGKGRKGHKKSRVLPGQEMVTLVNRLNKKAKDSLKERNVLVLRTHQENGEPRQTFTRRQSRLMQFLYDVDSLQDSVRVSEIETVYAKRLDENKLDIPFRVERLPEGNEYEPKYNEVTLGFTNPITYQLKLGNAFPFLLKRLSAAILFSLFLVGVTLLSFMLLYRNLLRERRLAGIKNEFISNITHELKTPIATVSVAIEALRSFSANMDPQRTKEYLTISANELQRLSLLVDKVLKLSMFEKKEVDLKYEALNMKDLVDEVTASMRLQFEKYHTKVTVTAEGDTTLEGDRLHLVSVIFNLLDNALKYTTDNRRIDISIRGTQNRVSLSVTDNGIGIPPEYREKIFEKFFRVPTGNLHNAKGYGLGLSYVAHVVKKHRGEIRVDSAVGEGSKFIIQLPKAAA